MSPRKILKTCVLYPLSKIYGLGVGVRSLLFRWNILKSRKFPVPVISVGNIAVGGTGKTPHSEYIINLLKKNYHVGVLSRGYKRKTRGFRQVTDDSTPLEVGDEPYQMFKKLADTSTFFAVCENRCAGINRMLQEDPEIDMIVLDDAFQHRYVEPTVSVVLTEFNRPVFNDRLLPLGRLREPMVAINRADIVVVTKCPPNVRPLEYRLFTDNLRLFPCQKLFFSNFNYKELVPLFPDTTLFRPRLPYLHSSDSILALAGIANPAPFIDYLSEFEPKISTLFFPDHHNFTKKDFDTIQKNFSQLNGNHNIIITTEKDAVRIIGNQNFPDNLKPSIFYLPVEVELKKMGEDNFDDAIVKLIKNAKIFTK